MDKVQIINIDNFKQLSLFFLLINNPKGLERDIISERLCIPRTTVYDNLLKLKKRFLVNKFSVNNHKKGRSKIFWFVPKYLRNYLLNVDLSKKIIVKNPNF